MNTSLLTAIISTLLAGTALAAPTRPTGPITTPTPIVQIELGSDFEKTLRGLLAGEPAGEGISVACNFECKRWRRVRTPYCAQWGRDAQGHGVCSKWGYNESDECVEWTCGH